MPQPPGVSIPAVTPEIIDRLASAVGADAVFVRERLMEDPDWPLRDPYWIPGNDDYAPGVAVQPSTTEQIQEVLAIARDSGIPVWTSSQGRSNAYGGSSARVGGSISLNLRRMNRVLEVHEDLAYAVVEPGVRWLDLDAELRRRGSRLAVSVPDIGGGSVIGNSLDNGITYLPYGADFMAPCGMEVVLANGEIVRTGLGAQPDNPGWHTYKRGVGPIMDQLFIQSNYGVVTRMGVWLMPRPEAFSPITLTVADDDDLAAAIDTIRELRLRGTLRGVPSVYNTLMAVGMTGLREKLGLSRRVLLTPDEIAQLRREHGLGAWNVRAALYGDHDEVEQDFEIIRRHWERIPGARATRDGVYGPDEYDRITNLSARISAGVPNLDLLRTMGPDYGHVDLSPVVPLEGRRVAEVTRATSDLIESRTGYNYGASVLVTGERSCAVILSVTFDPRDEAEATRAFDLGRDLVDLLGTRGYSEYRVHLDLMDQQAALFSHDDYAQRRLAEAIKDVVDPDGILSPGRYGIWPARFRG